MGGGQDRHVIQMIANASLDVIEEVMRKENTMYVGRSDAQDQAPNEGGCQVFQSSGQVQRMDSVGIYYARK
jgi:hypothetical protein